MEYVINPDGEKAKVLVEYDHYIPDRDRDSYYVYRATLVFDNESLNPPNATGWDIGEDNVKDQDYGYQHLEEADKQEMYEKFRESGTRLYEYILLLRGSVASDEIVDQFRVRYESERNEVIAKQRRIQDLEDTLRWRDARIKELETDYIKTLEAENEQLRQTMRLAYANMTESARLLSVNQSR